MDADLHNMRKNLSFEQKLAVAKDVAKAMYNRKFYENSNFFRNYLHKDLKLLHRDLKPSNILVTGKFLENSYFFID